MVHKVILWSSFRGITYCFSYLLIILHSNQKWTKISASPQLTNNWYFFLCYFCYFLFVCFFNTSTLTLKGYSIVVLIWISLMTNDASILSCAYQVFLYILEKYVLKFFTHVLIWFCWFFNICCWAIFFLMLRFIYTFWIFSFIIYIFFSNYIIVSL